MITRLFPKSVKNFYVLAATSTAKHSFSLRFRDNSYTFDWFVLKNTKPQKI